MKRLFFALFILNSISINSQTRVHIIVDGDNIYKLSRKYNIPARVIATVNEFKEINQPLVKYQQLIIPNKYYQTSQSKDRYIAEKLHTVINGESLYSISRKYQITVYDLLLLNPNIERGKPLEPGSQLKILASNNNHSQFSEQLIYLNGDQVKYDTILFTDTAKFNELVQKINQKHQDHLNKLIQKNNSIHNIALDTLTLPITDNTPVSALIHRMVIHWSENRQENVSKLDSLKQYILYSKSVLLASKSNRSDAMFKRNVMRLLHKYNEFHPSNDQLFSFRAMLYLWIKDYKKAYLLAEEALAINKDNIDAKLVIIQIYIEKNQFENAIFELEPLITLYPEHPIIQFNLAISYYYMLNPTKSIQNFLKVQTPSEILPETYYYIAKNMILNNDIENACTFLEKSNQLNFPKARIELIKYCKKNK